MEFKLPPAAAEAAATDPLILLLLGVAALGALVVLIGARAEIVTAALAAGIIGLVFAA